MRICRLLLLLFLLSIAAPAFATDYFVATDGNDMTGSGAIGNPWGTIQFMMQHLACGDTGYIRGVEYHGNGTFVNAIAVSTDNGTVLCASWANPATVKAYMHETVTLTEPAISFIIGGNGSLGFTCLWESVCRVPTDMYWIFEDLIVDGSTMVVDRTSNGIRFSNARHVHFINVTVKNVPGVGIAFNAANGLGCSTDPRLTGNVCPDPMLVYYPAFDNPQDDIEFIGTSSLAKIIDNGHCGGSDMCGDGHAGYLTVQNSIMTGYEISGNLGQSPQFTNSGSTHVSNNTFCGNYVHDNGSGPIMGDGDNNLECNNVMVDNGGANGAFSDGCTHCNAYGNTSWGTAGFVFTPSYGGGIVKNNIVPYFTVSGTVPPTFGNNFIGGTPGFAGGMGAAAYELVMGASAGPPCGADLAATAASLGQPQLLLDFYGNTRPVPPTYPSCGAFDTIGTSAASLTSITASMIDQGATGQNLVIVGNNSNFDGTSVVSFSPSTGITKNTTTATNATHITVNVDIAGNAPLGNRAVSVNTGSGAEIATGVNLTILCTPDHLTYIDQPTNTTIGGSMGTASVGIYSSHNELCTNALNPVTFSKHGSATWNSLQVTMGSLVIVPVGGIASISTMYVSPTTGSGKITASASGLTSVDSTPITISSAPSNPCSSPPCTFYISYTDGNDALSGLDTSHPWKHLPMMQGATGNPDYYTAICGPMPCTLEGYKFILKGGDTWPHAVWTSTVLLPFQGTGSVIGTSAAYVGVDQSYYAGSAWSRPIFDWGGIGSGPMCQAMWLNSPTNFLIVDNIEFTGMYWDHTCNPDATPSSRPVYLGINVGGGNEWENMYFHGWSFEYSGSGGTGDCHYSGRDCDFMFLMTAAGGTGTSIHDNAFDGWDVDHTHGNSGFGIKGSAPDIYRNYFNYLTSGQATEQAVTAWHDNVCNHIGISMGQQHDQCFEDNGSNGPTYIYNNISMNSTAGQGFWLSPAFGQTAYFFNNVIFNSDLSSSMIACQDTNHVAEAGTCNVLNNTIFDNFSNLALGCGYYAPMMPSAEGCNYQNNHFISDTTNLLTSCAGGPTQTCTQDHNTLQTLAAAATNGFSSMSYPEYIPTLDTAATIGQGTDLSSLCGVNAHLAQLCKTSRYGVTYNATSHTITGYGTPDSVTRRATPNTGAYQFNADSPLIVTVTPPSGLQGSSYTIDVYGLNTAWDNTSFPDMDNTDLGVAIPSWTLINSAHMQFPLIIAPTANVGFRNVYIVTGAQTLTLTNGFLVQSPNVTVGVGAGRLLFRD